MSDIQALTTELQSFGSLSEGAVKLQRATRLWVSVERQSFPALFDHLVKTRGFGILCTITGLDVGPDLELIYHLARDGGIMVNVKVRFPKGEPIPTVTPYFPGATLYERELEDLLGAVIEGLPEGRRYPLPDDWPADEHPLLKDWAPKGATPSSKGMKAEGEADE